MPTDDLHRVPREKLARQRATENVDRWGQQPPIELVAAIAGVVGELVNEIMVDEPNDAPGAARRVDADLLAVHNAAHELRQTLEDIYEDDDGEPLAPGERPSLSVLERDEIDVEDAREELLDALALLNQLDWAFYQGVRAGDLDGR